MQISDWINLLLPYQFSPVIAALALTLPILYIRGSRASARQGARIGFGRHLAFFVGFLLCYLVLHTRFDYYAQYMFFMHRLQHLVLHHVGPFLIALSAPWSTLAHGLPKQLQRWLGPLVQSRPTQTLYRTLQHPVVAPLLFVGLIYFWLTPAVHFDAMLSLPLYHLMNTSMLVDGLLFWWLMLNPSVRHTPAHVGYGVRILILLLISVPQIVLGAYIAFSPRELFDVYSVCGRAWPIPPLVDQQLGGLLTWIPSAMMSLVGVLVVLKLLFRQERQKGNIPKASGTIAAGAVDASA